MICVILFPVYLLLGGTRLSQSKIHRILSGLNQIKWSIALKGILSGLAAGLLVVFYRLGIEYGTDTAMNAYKFMRTHPIYLVGWIPLILVIGLLIAWIIRKEPMSKGSGIPQVEGMLLYGMKMKWYSILVARFICGIASSFFGISLGREGPSIQIGASAGQAIAKKTGRNKMEENYLITGGAAAGLSAAFNAPLSGVVFALEEVHRSFSPLILIAATTASLTADVVSKNFFGLKPVLNFTATPQLPMSLYLWLLPLGILAGLAGALTNKALLRFQTLYGWIPPRIRPIVALLLVLPCGLFLPEVLGGGQNLVQLAEKADVGIVMLFVFLCVKLLITCTSFGSGIPGGIFMPILSIGALSGSLLGLVAAQCGLLPAEYIPDFAVCAMAGALSASVKAPVTSILLVAEMTGSLVHLLPVAACSFIALLLSDALKVTPIYEALLDRINDSDADNGSAQGTGNGTRSKSGTLVESPVEFGCPAAGKPIAEIDWPAGTLVVSIRRGNKEIVPNGNTVILPGDYLVILSTEGAFSDINSRVREFCHAKPDGHHDS